MNEHPAFPVSYQGGRIEGMTLRDYFAAKAMMGLGCNPNHVSMTDDEIAKWSYNLADAMMKERK